MKAPRWKSNIAMTVALSMTVGQAAFAEGVKVVEDYKVVAAQEEAPTFYRDSKPVPAQELYPDGALMQVYQEELIEIKRTEEAERKAVQTRDEYEKRKVESEQQIAAKKYQIENYKMRQEKVQSDVDMMKVELNDLTAKQNEAEGELKIVEQKAQEHFQTMDSTRQELADNQKRLEETVEQLRITRDKTAAAVNKGQIEIQRMRAEMAVLDAEVQKADSKKTELEAAEMKTRTEWMAIKQQIEDYNVQKAEYNKQAVEARVRYEKAQKDLKLAQNEVLIAEKDNKQTAFKVSAEVERLEAAIINAAKSKAMAEANKLRLEAETEKLKAYVAMVRQTKDKASEDQKDAEGLVMQSKLALETAKAELTKEVAKGDSDEFRSKKTEARLRGLASAAEASEMLDGGRLWQSSKSCKLYRRPSTSSQEMGTVVPGRRLVGSEVSGAWIKLMNTSGSAIYVDKSCGQFE